MLSIIRVYWKELGEIWKKRGLLQKGMMNEAW